MAIDEREGAGFFLNDPQKLDNPFPDFAYFREHRPIFYYLPLGEWFVFRFDDVSSFFTDPRLSADRMKGFLDAVPEEMRGDVAQLVPFFESWVLMKDGEAHTGLRSFLNLGFNAQAIEGMSGLIQQAADELLDAVQDKGRMDVSGDYGFLLPAYVLSDFMGVHKEDRGRVVQWSVDFVDFFNEIPITVDTSRRMVRSAREMQAYTRGLLAERRANPKHDFLGILVNARTQAGTLTEDEIVGNAMLLLLAGHVAVRNLIGNAVWLLLTHPDQRALLEKQPELLPAAIEESLRCETPVALIPRVALQDIELAEGTIKQAHVVQLSLASANRDAAHFPDPERFDITRQPGRVLSFGYGPHGCLGAHLAREEARIALEALFRRMPSLRLDERTPIRWYRNAGNRGPITLPALF